MIKFNLDLEDFIIYGIKNEEISQTIDAMLFIGIHHDHDHKLQSNGGREV